MYELIKEASKKVTGKLTSGEIIGNLLFPVGPIITSTKAKEGKRWKTFGHTAGRSLVGSILGSVPGAMLKSSPTQVIGGLSGAILGHSLGKKRAKELGYLERD